MPTKDIYMEIPKDPTVIAQVKKINATKSEDRENILLLLKEDFINMNRDGDEKEGSSEVFGLTREQFMEIFKATGNEMTFHDLSRSIKERGVF